MAPRIPPPSRVVACCLLALLAAASGRSPAAVDGSPGAQPLDVELATLLEWVTGEFDNRRQVDSGVNRLADAAPDPVRAPGPLFPVFARVEAPALGRHVVYLQWPEGAPDGPLQRQRLWAFEVDAARDAVLMDFFTLRDPARWRDAHLHPDTALRSITRADVVPYPAACRLPFRRDGDAFVGEIPSGACRIVSQQTRTDMTIGARVVVTRDGLGYEESGVRPDGSVVFRVPAVGRYEFDRRRPKPRD